MPNACYYIEADCADFSRGCFCDLCTPEMTLNDCFGVGEILHLMEQSKVTVEEVDSAPLDHV